MTETLEPDGTALGSMPPFTQARVSYPPDERFTVVSFADARDFKLEAIRQRETAVKSTFGERVLDDDGRLIQLFRLPLDQATSSANLYR